MLFGFAKYNLLTMYLWKLASTALLSCDFETDMCQFTQDNSDVFDWTRFTGATGSTDTGPTAGHGGSGYYIYIEATGQDLDDYAIIISPALNHVGQACVQFYTHMYGVETNELEIFLHSGNAAPQEVFNISGNQGDLWIKREVVVSLTSASDKISFKASTMTGFKGDISLDTILITDAAEGYCTQEGSLSDFNIWSCDFEVNECSFIQASTDVFDWTRKTGATLSTATGPTSAQDNSGYYVYIEATGRSLDDDATIISPSINYTGTACVKFWTHMYGADTNELMLFLQRSNGNMETMYSISGNKGNEWIQRKVLVTFNSASDRIGFTATTGDGFEGDIAVDTITVTNHTDGCLGRVQYYDSNSDKNTLLLQRSQYYFTLSIEATSGYTTVLEYTTVPSSSARVLLSCDFESDLCQFSQDNTDDFDWKRLSGATSSSNTGPSNGQGDYGYYMYIEASGIPENDKANILTPPLNHIGPACVEFWTHLYGTEIKELNVFVQTGGSQTQVFGLTGNQGDQWVQQKVLVKLTSASDKIGFTGVVGSDFHSDIAVDTIKITDGTESGCGGGMGNWTQWNESSPCDASLFQKTESRVCENGSCVGEDGRLVHCYPDISGGCTVAEHRQRLCYPEIGLKYVSPVNNWRLVNHTFQSFVSKSEVVCLSKCITQLTCSSVNYRTLKQDEGLCHLNSEVPSNVTKDTFMEYHLGYNFFSIR